MRIYPQLGLTIRVFICKHKTELFWFSPCAENKCRLQKTVSGQEFAQLTWRLGMHQVILWLFHQTGLKKCKLLMWSVPTSVSSPTSRIYVPPFFWPWPQCQWPSPAASMLSLSPWEAAILSGSPMLLLPSPRGELTPFISSCVVQHGAEGSKSGETTTPVPLVALIPKEDSSICEGESHRSILSSDSAVLLPWRNDSLALCHQHVF